MPDKNLRPASRESIVFALSHGLLYNTVGNPHRHRSELAATLATEIFRRQLERQGFVSMRTRVADDGARAEGRQLQTR
jgi:hypothetical protein